MGMKVVEERRKVLDAINLGTKKAFPQKTCCFKNCVLNGCSLKPIFY
jgi:hypothetical protein